MATTEQTTTIELSHTLTPVLSDRFVARWSHVAITGLFALLFLFLSYLPIFHAESWRHVGQGAWMIAHRAIPTSDPLLPLAVGMSYQNTAWLSQVAFAMAEHWGGTNALSVLLTLLQFTAFVLFSLAAFKLSGRKLLAIITTFMVVAVAWPQLNLIRPAAFGLLLLAGLLLVVSRLTIDRRDQMAWWHWILVPGLIALWANLDATFVVGLLVIWASALGRGIDVWRRTKSFNRVLADRRTRSWVWLAELCLVATLVQPYGLQIWTQFFSGANSSWWTNLGGFNSLNPLTWQGAAFVVLWAVAVVLLRLSRRRLRAAEVILLAVGSVGVLCNQDLVVFFAPLACLSLLPHARYVLQRAGWLVKSAPTESARAATAAAEGQQSFKFALSLVCVLLVWVAFSLSPASQPLLGGKVRSAEHLYDSHTPVALARYLSEHPTRHMAWAPAYWGDWLAWTQGNKHQFFAGSQANMLPQQVRHDYGRVFRGEGNWLKVLDRYGVETLIADKAQQLDLIDAASHGASPWQRVYEDDQAVVFVRREAHSQQGGQAAS